jgi:transcriptional regulator with XRE-family HTH domain
MAAVDAVRVRMKERRVSGKRLAEAVGMPQTSLARLLRGRGDLTLDQLAAIARALDTNLPGIVHDSIEGNARFGSSDASTMPKYGT